MNLSIQAIIDEQLAKGREHKEKDCWYVTDYGRCPCGVFMERMGTPNPSPVDERTKRVFEMGNRVEDFVVDALDKKGLIIEKQGSITYPEINVRGRFDVLIKNEKNGAQLVEVKSMHSQGFHWRKKSGFKPLEHHEAQVLMYLGKLKEKYPEITGGLCYVSKDDLLIQQIPIPWNDKKFKSIREYFLMLEKSWKDKVRPDPVPAVVYDLAKKKWVVNWQADYCGYHTLCTGDPLWKENAMKEAKDKNKEL